jgi:large subunit ribosomal protein L25
MAEVLNVQNRNSRGKRDARRLRQEGSVPAVLYGHGKENVCLAVLAEDMDAVVRHGARLVELQGAVNEQAFVRDLQWDTWGTHILHIDFTRISAHEKVEVEVHVELRGEAPGVRQGGVVEQLLHQVGIECEATEIPEVLLVNVNELNLEESITLGQLKLPKTAKILADPDAVVVQCVAPMEELEEIPAEAGEAEPEVIGRKSAEEGEEQ